ncbi:MAG TPA: aminoacyl-tRNA hydrolase [Acidimicrobiales bacterium]|nr:aminoacyl-tRNA hydrolase [Acidimicrobiales bacterium]
MGLGNPGQEFAASRHNVGADAVRRLAERQGAAPLKPMRGQRAAVAEVRLGHQAVALAVPTTFMNESGEAVRPLVRRFGIEDPERLVVLHDELDLPPGRIRVKVGGGTAGHNGLRSLQSHLHTTDFVRIRIGVGKPPSAAAGADYVLRRPPKAEREALNQAIESAADAVEVIATEGVAAAMNRFNAETAT